MLLSFISTLPTLALSAVTFKFTVVFVAVVSLAVRLFVTLTLSCKLTVLVPLARSSKSAFEVVVVMKLSSTSMSSNCALAPILIF